MQAHLGIRHVLQHICHADHTGGARQLEPFDILAMGCHAPSAQLFHRLRTQVQAHRLEAVLVRREQKRCIAKPHVQPRAAGLVGQHFLNHLRRHIALPLQVIAHHLGFVGATENDIQRCFGVVAAAKNMLARRALAPMHGAREFLAVARVVGTVRTAQRTKGFALAQRACLVVDQLIGQDCGGVCWRPVSHRRSWEGVLDHCLILGACDLRMRSALASRRIANAASAKSTAHETKAPVSTCRR